MHSGGYLIHRLVVVTILVATSCCAESRTLREWRVGPFYNRVVIWAGTDLTEPNLRSYYQQLSRELTGNRAWRVDVFSDEGDATRELYGKLRTEGDYDWWLGLYNKFGRKLLPKAEILSYAHNAVLRMRDTAGSCSEVVLSGDNFLRVHVGSIEFEILETYYHRLPPRTKPSHGDEAMISVYVRASSFPNVDQAREFGFLMRKRFRQKRIIVLIRTDSYFITDLAFPIMYRFDRDGVPPTREQYEQSKTMCCLCDRPAVLCR